MSDLSVNNNNQPGRSASTGSRNRAPSGTPVAEYTVTAQDIEQARLNNPGNIKTYVCNKRLKSIMASHPTLNIDDKNILVSDGPFGPGSVIRFYSKPSSEPDNAPPKKAPAPQTKKTPPPPDAPRPKITPVVQTTPPEGISAEDHACGIAFIREFDIYDRKIEKFRHLTEDEAQYVFKIVYNACEAEGIDWRDGLALIAVESKFTRTAYNPSGCTGMMQLGYGAAKDLGLSPLVENPDPKSKPDNTSFSAYDARYDLKQAIPAGIKYLVRTCKYSSGSDMSYQAIGRYNVGPYNANGKLKTTDAEIFKYNETRGYTVRFMACRNALMMNDYRGAYTAATENNNRAATRFDSVRPTTVASAR